MLQKSHHSVFLLTRHMPGFLESLSNVTISIACMSMHTCVRAHNQLNLRIYFHPPLHQWRRPAMTTRRSFTKGTHWR